MIKKFKNYINEDLDPEVFTNAALKLKSMGHVERSIKLLNWSESTKRKKIFDRCREFGEYSMNYRVVFEDYEWTNPNTKVVNPKQSISLVSLDTSDISRKNANIRIKEAPNKCYIRGLTCADYEDEYDMLNIEDVKYLKKISIDLFILDIETGVSLNAFNFNIPITWLEDMFIVNNEISISHGWNDDESKVLFSDRSSAFKFKKLLTTENIIKLLNNIKTGAKDKDSGYEDTYYDALRKFFMTYSTGSDFEKVFTLISSVTVNSLYN